MDTKQLLGAGLALALACGTAVPQIPPAVAAPRTYGTIPAEAWIDAALSSDRGLKARRIELERARAALAALEAPSMATPSFETGTTTLKLPDAGSPVSISAKPAVSIALAEPWSTAAKLSVGIEAPLDGSTDPAFEPSLALTQALDALVYGKTSLALLEARRALADAESALRAAEAQVAASTLQLLQAWAQAGYEASSRKAALSQASRALAEAKTLGTYAPGSAALARLEYAASSAAVSLEKAARALTRARDAASSATGLADDAPPAPSAGDLVPIELLGIDRARAVVQAGAKLSLEERSYADRWESRQASLAATLAASAFRQVPSGDYALSGRLGASAAWDDLSLGAGMGWDGRGSLAYVDFSLSWKPDAASAEDAERLKAGLSLAASRLSLESAGAAAESDLEELRAARADRALETRRLAEALDLATKELSEARAQAAAGIVALSEVDEALDLWIQAAAAVEKAAWDRAVADARVAIDFILPEVSE